MSTYPAYTPRSERAPRRDEVRRLLEDGYSAREIAKKMDITTQAVYDHIAKIRREDGEI